MKPGSMTCAFFDTEDTVSCAVSQVTLFVTIVIGACKRHNALSAHTLNAFIHGDLPEGDECMIMKTNGIRVIWCSLLQKFMAIALRQESH